MGCVCQKNRKQNDVLHGIDHINRNAPVLIRTPKLTRFAPGNSGVECICDVFFFFFFLLTLFSFVLFCFSFSFFLQNLTKVSWPVFEILCRKNPRRYAGPLSCSKSISGTIFCTKNFWPALCRCFCKSTTRGSNRDQSIKSRTLPN